MEKIPSFSVDLIKQLDELYPEKCPSVKDSDRDIWIYAGKRELVRNLVNLQKSFEEDKYKQELEK